MPRFPTTLVSPNVRHAVRWGVAALALTAAGLAPVAAQTREEVDRAKAERESVRDEAARVADSIDALGDEADDLIEKLDLLAITVSAAEARLAVATEQVATTEAQLAAVEAEIATLEAARDELQRVLRATAVDQYIAGHENEQGTVLTTDDPVAWALRQGLYRLVVTDIADARDQLRVIEDRLDAAQADATTLAADARAELDEASLLQADLAAVQVQQAEVLGQVRERLDHRLAEAESLARLDEELSEEIRRGEAEIARRIAIAEALQNMDSGDGSSRKDLIARPDEIVNVRGIEIHYTLADQLLALINHAEADGIILGGFGWRSTERQIELRMQNCGTTDYLIFDAPSEECWPPTARPATSNHEAGRAVDFTANGAAITNRDSAGFQWLAQHASTYGFYNLWSEPWHWSDDGR